MSIDMFPQGFIDYVFDACDAEQTAGAIDARAGLNPQEPDSHWYMLGYNAEKELAA